MYAFVLKSLIVHTTLSSSVLTCSKKKQISNMSDMLLNRGVNTKNDEMVWVEYGKEKTAGRYSVRVKRRKMKMIEKLWEKMEMATERGWTKILNSNFANAELSTKFVHNAFYPREWIKQVLL